MWVLNGRQVSDEICRRCAGWGVIPHADNSVEDTPAECPMCDGTGLKLERDEPYCHYCDRRFLQEITSEDVYIFEQGHETCVLCKVLNAL